MFSELSETLQNSIIVGAVAIATASIPSIISLATKLIDHRYSLKLDRQQREHSRFLDAAENYYDALSVLQSHNCPPESRQRFLAAHNRLSSYVTQDTLNLMETIVEKLEFVETNGAGQSPDFDVFHITRSISRQLNAELNIADEYKQHYGGKSKRRKSM